MPRTNPSHPEDWLDEEIDSLLRSVEDGEELESPAQPASAAERAWARWFRRPATEPRADVLSWRAPRRLRPGISARTRAFFERHHGDLGFYAFGVAAAALLGWLIVLLEKP
jgi:hypothetical protein